MTPNETILVLLDKDRNHFLPRRHGTRSFASFHSRERFCIRRIVGRRDLRQFLLCRDFRDL